MWPEELSTPVESCRAAAVHGHALEWDGKSGSVQSPDHGPLVTANQAKGGKLNKRSATETSKILLSW